MSGTRRVRDRSDQTAPGYEIRDRSAARAIVAPLRQDIVDALDAAGPCSIAELAELLGRPADSLYFHLRKLEKVGLIVEVERRREGRHVFRVYDVPGHPMTLRYAPPIRAADLAGIARSAFRAATKDFAGAVGDESVADKQGPERELWMARAKGWLTKAQLHRVNALLAEVLATVRAGKGRRLSARPGPERAAHQKLFALTFGFAPVRVVARGAAERGPAKKRGKRRGKESS
jgi:DNA-binding transcriptional ArsR family regulator